MSQQLVSHFAGQVLFNRGTTEITAPSSWDRFPCLLDLLNGQGSNPNILTIPGESLAESIKYYGETATPAIVDTWHAGITSEDKVYITAAATPFRIRHKWGPDVLGIGADWVDSHDFPSFLFEGTWSIIAPNDWIRGEFLSGSDPGNGLIGYEIDDNNGAAFNIYPPLGRMPGVLEWVREQAEADALSNAATANVSYLDQQTGPFPGVRWFLSDAGKVTVIRPYFVYSIEWTNTEFRDWLGFSGNEAETPDGTGCFAMEADNYAQGLLWLDRPIEYFEPEIRSTRIASELSDGRFEQAHISTVKGWRLRFAITGLASSVDRLMNAQEDFFAYLWRSEFFTVFLNTQERRLARRGRDGYSREITGEDDYRMGIHRLVLDPGISSASFNLEDPSVRSRYFLELIGWNWVSA